MRTNNVFVTGKRNAPYTYPNTYLGSSMKMISLKRLAALSAILILRINSAGAAPIPPPIPDTVVNMPATAANSVVNDPNDYCYVGPGAVIFAATDPASFCTIALCLLKRSKR